MQTDTETIIIHTDLTDSIKALQTIQGELRMAQIGLTINNIGHHDIETRRRQILGDIISSLSTEIDAALDRLNTLFEKHHKDDYVRQTRAFEFLGDMLSGITGVPSARDHRALLERVQMLRLDNEGIKNLMSSRNAQHRLLLKTMTQQSNKITRLHNRLLTTERYILQHDRDDLQLAGILALQDKAQLALRHMDRIYIKVNNILMLGDNDQLSRYGISKKELGVILDSIILRRKTGVPIYGRDEIENYYKLKLSHSWTIPAMHEVVTLIQIPISPLLSKTELKILDTKNTMSTDLTMAVIDNQANSFRYLSLADFHRCTELKGRLICQKRLIQILPPMGCSLRLKNCELWATLVVHDITNTDFIFISNKNATQISVTCGKQDPVSQTLPTSAMVKVPLSCSVTSDTFSIESSAIHNIIDIQGDKPTIDIQIDVNPTVLSSTPIKNLTESVDFNRENLTELRRLSDRFENDLDQQRQSFNDKWNSIDTGSIWYDLANWTLIGICMVACIILCLWLVRLTCDNNTIEGNQIRDRQEQETITSELLDRITALETAAALIGAELRRNNESRV